jgi:AbrB family looped-hinge helix DNA binding protein
MAELLAVVTRKGQVTIPAEVRKALDLKRGDMVAFSLPSSPADATTVRRAPAGRTSVVEELFGSLHSEVPALTPAEEKAAFERAVALEADSEPERSTRTHDHAEVS